MFMNKFWQSILKVRDFSYEMSIKQMGKEGAASDYKFKFLGFISGYVFTIIFAILQILFYFFGTGFFPVTSQDPIIFKILLGLVILYLPLDLIKHFLLKKISHIPLPEDYNKHSYIKNFTAYILF